MTALLSKGAPDFVGGVDRNELIGRMRALQARKRSMGSRLTVAVLIERLSTYTAFESTGTPAAFWMTPADARAVDRLTAAAVTLCGEASPDTLRELVESVATLHRMRPADVLQMRVQSAVELIA